MCRTQRALGAAWGRGLGGKLRLQRSAEERGHQEAKLTPYRIQPFAITLHVTPDLLHQHPPRLALPPTQPSPSIPRPASGIGYFIGAACVSFNYFFALSVLMVLILLAMPWAALGLSEQLGRARKVREEEGAEAARGIVCLRHRSHQVSAVARDSGGRGASSWQQWAHDWLHCCMWCGAVRCTNPCNQSCHLTCRLFPVCVRHAGEPDAGQDLQAAVQHQRAERVALLPIWQPRHVVRGAAALLPAQHGVRPGLEPSAHGAVPGRVDHRVRAGGG